MRLLWAQTPCTTFVPLSPVSGVWPIRIPLSPMSAKVELSIRTQNEDEVGWLLVEHSGVAAVAAARMPDAEVCVTVTPLNVTNWQFSQSIACGREYSPLTSLLKP